MRRRRLAAALISMAEWHLYILRTRMDTLYTGIATDVERRMDEHAGGRTGAKSLRARGPLQLVYQVALGSRALASQAEYQVKQLTRTEKQSLIKQQPGAEQLLQKLKLANQTEENA